MFRWLPESGAALSQRCGQVRFQTLQLRDLAPDHRQLLRDQIPHVDANLIRMALNRKQLTNLIQRKAELLRPLDKFQIGDLLLAIEPVSALGASRPRQQARLLIEADRIDAQASFVRNLADLERSCAHLSEAYSLELAPESSAAVESSELPAHITFVVNDNRRFIEVNDETVLILGLTRDQILGRRMDVFFTGNRTA